MLKKRLIARLDIRNDRLIKPVNCEGVRVVGDPREYARRYNDEGIDEMLFLDSVASLYGRNSLESLLSEVSEGVFCPITVGGGIRTVEDARRLLRAGADKIAINTAAVQRPMLINEMAETFGSQCMVLQIDAKKTPQGWEAYTHGGREHTGMSVTAWAAEGVARGAGELLLTSIDREGTRRGFDLQLIRSIAAAVPVVASGGCGGARHVADAVAAGADGVALADALHYRRLSLPAIRRELADHRIQVRMPTMKENHP